MAKTKQQPDPLEDPLLVRQVRQLMDLTGQVDPSVLDEMGKSKNSKFINQLLQFGYHPRGGNLGGMFMSDSDAMGAAIQMLREGVTPRTDLPGREKFLETPGTASGNYLKYLIQDRMAGGMSLEQAKSLVGQELGTEIGGLKAHEKAKGAGASLTPAEAQALSQQGQIGGQGYSAESIAQAIDKAAQNQLNTYMMRGVDDITQYKNEANLMRTSIPKELQPIFDSQVSQRAQEMQNNLNLYQQQQEFAPYMDALTQAAKDYIKGPKASSANSLNQALSGLAGANATVAGGGSPIASMGPLTGRDLGNQLLEAMKWSKGMGAGFAGFAKGVDSGSQIQNLRNLIPASKTGWRTLPTFLANINQ